MQNNHLIRFRSSLRIFPGTGAEGRETLAGANRLSGGIVRGAIPADRFAANTQCYKKELHCCNSLSFCGATRNRNLFPNS